MKLALNCISENTKSENLKTKAQWDGVCVWEGKPWLKVRLSATAKLDNFPVVINSQFITESLIEVTVNLWVHLKASINWKNSTESTPPQYRWIIIIFKHFNYPFWRKCYRQEKCGRGSQFLLRKAKHLKSFVPDHNHLCSFLFGSTGQKKQK